MQSAVRLPTPPPGPSLTQPVDYNSATIYKGTTSEYTTKRKRLSPTPSPPRKHLRGPPPKDVDPGRAEERVRQQLERQKLNGDDATGAPKPRTEEEKRAAAKAEYEALLGARSGGRYIPPARLRELAKQFTDKSTKEYQRMYWENLKKSINGMVNKVNVGSEYKTPARGNFSNIQ